MCKVISVVNQKGGVGKTTTTVNVGIGLAREGKKVLLIDADPQGSLTASLGYEEPDDLRITLATIMMDVINEEEISLEDGILHHQENVDLLPANIELSALEVTMGNVMSREMIMKEYIDAIRGRYDYILIDCMPSLGMMTINALVSSDSVLIPVQAAYLPVKGLQQLIKTILTVKKKLMQEVMEETGITATAGVGTNLYLAKIAMDIVAKHVDDHIGILDEFSYREQLWDHKPLSDFWRIGSRTEKKLAGYGIHTMGDIAMASLRSEDWLYKMFGIDAELLIDHAWGYETCRMSDIKNYHSEEHSLSNGQVLMRNYSFDEALVIVREMTDNLVLDLFEKGLVTSSLTLWIAYDHRYEHEASKGTVKLERESNSSKKIIDAVEDLYLRIADRYTGIRRIEVCANRVVPESYVQYSLFDDPKQTDKERHLQEAVLNVKQRYGKNAIMRGSNLLECSTYRERNEQIGGHRA